MSNKPKKSIFAELSFASATAILIMMAIIIGSIVVFITMNVREPKNIYVKDDADIFTSSELDDIEDYARSLCEDEDINVIVVTTRDKGKGYSNSDSDCAKFAADFYEKHCISNSFRDNSGICILIDLTLDYQGGRFFWIYTYGTAYFSIDDEECTEIFQSHKKELQDQEYGKVIKSILKDINGTGINSMGIGALYFFSLIVPLILAFFISWGSSKNKRLDRRPNSTKYKKTHYDRGDQDTYLRKSVVVTHHSSSSGGGGGGGGGGGHSGGGGGRF